MNCAALLYHDVTDAARRSESGFPGAVANRYKLSIERFESHLEAIAATGVTVALPQSNPTNVEPFCCLTFDDGGVSFLTEIAPRLERRGWRGLFFLSTDFLGTPGFLSPEQAKELARRGHLVGSHSSSHPANIAALNDDLLAREWRQSCERLAEMLQQSIWTASVPGGFYSRRVAQFAEQAGIRLLFNSEPTTRWHQLNELTVAGRLQIVDDTPASDAARLAQGDRSLLWKRQGVWFVKKAAKAVLGGWYRQFSARLFRDRAAPST